MPDYIVKEVSKKVRISVGIKISTTAYTGDLDLAEASKADVIRNAKALIKKRKELDLTVKKPYNS